MTKEHEADGQDRPAAISYSVRVSPEARRVRLVMKPQGLEVVVPQGFNRRSIPGLVEGKRAWIERAEARIQAYHQRLVEDPPCLPTRITLPAVDEEWAVEYHTLRGSESGRYGQSPQARVREAPGRRLVVTCDIKDFAICRQALCRWLARRAKRDLVARLVVLAKENGFEYGNVTIRQQRTRWGSCSRKGNISLNARLLLMPPEAVDYVLLHELCHTSRLDHSPGFWALLETHDPGYRAHKKLVRACAKSLPTWLDHEPDDEAM